MDFPRFFVEFVHSQLFVTPPKPTKSWAGRTVIVTGANAGLGLEAAKHIAALQPGKLIIACRSVSKGEAAKREILEQVPSCNAEAIEVRELDLSSYDSVKDFAAKVNEELPRLDSLIEGAGINKNGEFKTTAQDEQTLTTNIVSTFLLALLLLPKLKQTAKEHSVKTTLSVVSSELSHVAKFPERRLPKGHIFPALNDSKSSNQGDRYQTTKLIQVMMVHVFAKRLGPAESTPVIVSAVNPGLNVTPMTSMNGREGMSMGAQVALRSIKIIARKADIGSRVYVLATEAGPEVHGHYLSNGKVARPPTAVVGTQGDELCEKVWSELAEKLDGIVPGVTSNL